MKTRLKGRVQAAVRQDGELVHTYPWQDNLILDQGLDYVASNLYNQLFIACAAGNGTSPTQVDPGTTATVSGNTLTATAPTFSTADLAANVVFDSGQIVKIIGYTSATQVTVEPSSTLATPTHFIIEYVNQAVLDSELKRTSEYLTTPGGCGATVALGAITLQRTFLFTPEAVTVTYSELGFSPEQLAGANLFSRVCLTNVVTVQGPSADLPNGQQLQVTYQLEIGFDYGFGSGVIPNPLPPNSPVDPITIAGLPIPYSIWQYATSSTQLNQLAVTIAGTMPVSPGGNIILAGSSYAPYNGTWVVLDSSTFTDGSHGPSTILSLQLPFVSGSSATGGTVNVDMNGFWFRGCQGIYLINAYGQSVPPSPTPTAFLGYDEPSVDGAVWVSTAGPNALGSNGDPWLIPVIQVTTAPCEQSAYVAGSFSITQAGTIAIGQNGLTLWSFGYGYPDTVNQIDTYCFDQPHALSPSSTLQLTFTMNWGRS